MKTVSIQPIKVQFNSANNATLFGVYITNDNLVDTCTLEWRLISVDESENQTLEASGEIEVTGEDYTNWNGSNDFPVTFAAGKVGVTLI